MPKGKHNSPKRKRVIPKAAIQLEKELEAMAAPKGNCLNPNGRPEKEIDWAMFEQLCGIHCTTAEIASFLKVHEDTLRPRAVAHYGGGDYSAIYKKFQETGKCSLRRNQFAMSKTNASMAIWLGKQYLAQKDKEEDVHVTPETMAAFQSFMDMLTRAQSAALNKEETNNNTESKS